MRKGLIFLFLAGASLNCFAENEVTYSSANDDTLFVWGKNAAQTYSVGIAVNDPELVGASVTSVSVPVLEAASHTDYSVWISKELSVTKVDGERVFVPDMVSVNVTPSPYEDEVNMINYFFPDGYLIPDEGLYVGYTFTVTEIKDDIDYTPVLVCNGGKPGGMWVYATKSMRKWIDYAESQEVAAAIKVGITGDFGQYSASVAHPQRLYQKACQNSLANFRIANHGTEEINNISYELTLNGETISDDYVFEPAIPSIFGREGLLPIEVPGQEEGVYDYTLKVTRVNGESNQSSRGSGGNTIDAMSKIPVKRTVLEEMTGLSCAYCVRGIVGLEKMGELHEDFIGIAYHKADALSLPASKLPDLSPSMPKCWLDRKSLGDPYFGLKGSEPFGIEEDWLKMQKEFTPVSIELTAAWEDNYATLAVTSDVEWMAASDLEGDYRVEYVLVADGLTDDSWVQQNAYHNVASEDAGIYMEPFCNGGEYGREAVTKLSFNDVAIDNTGGYGVEGSITSIEPLFRNTYTHRFDVAGNKLVQNKDNLRVVAMVVLADKKSGAGYGQVANANVCAVPSESKVEEIDVEAIGVRYYDLMGRETLNPHDGVFIKKELMNNGKVRTQKVILR